MSGEGREVGAGLRWGAAGRGSSELGFRGLGREVGAGRGRDTAGRGVSEKVTARESETEE